MEVRIDKTRTSENVTLEQWGFANIQIMNALTKSGNLPNSAPYLQYTADIFRLASKYVWFSVLLYDKQYREQQARENFECGTYRQDLREFNLVHKSYKATSRAFQEAGIQTPFHNSAPDRRLKGPFLPNEKEICRSFNSNMCTRPTCRMAYNCAICLSCVYSAVNYSQDTSKSYPTVIGTPQNGPAQQ